MGRMRPVVDPSRQTAVDVLQADVPAALRTKLDAAVKHCPTHALAIEDV
jgi:ferredoxin